MDHPGRGHRAAAFATPASPLDPRRLIAMVIRTDKLTHAGYAGNHELTANSVNNGSKTMIKPLKYIVLAAALATASAFPALADSIKVGFNAPLTGFAAADGNSALIGAQLAVEQVNAAGGINGEMLELLVYDDQASPKESAPLAVKMITQDEVAAGISGSYGC